MKPTFTPCIIPSQRKADGTYNVKIRVTYNRKSRRLSTALYATPRDLTRSLNFKDGALKDKAYALAADMRNLCSEIDYLKLQTMGVDAIIKFLDSKAEERAVFQLDFVEYMRKKAETKGASKSYYITALNALLRYLKGRTLYVNDITTRFLYDFEDFLRNEPKCTLRKDAKNKATKGDSSSLGVYIGYIRHVYGLARKEFNDPDLGVYRIPNNPFEYYKVPKQRPSKRRNKTQEFVQKVINESAKAKGVTKVAFETFLLSFALQGINLADLYNCAPSKDGWLIYNRQKTSERRSDRAEHHVFIPSVIKPIVERYRDRDGAHMFNFHRRYASSRSFTCCLNKTVQRNCAKHKFSYFTIGSARHTFGSIARKKGVEKATIDEMLCHVGNLRVADVYIEPDWEIHKKANEKLLKEFDWSPIQ